MNITTTNTRPQWPHTLDDIVNSLEGVWGLVGATGTNGNLLRLEKSLHEPIIYTVTEYRLVDEADVVSRQNYEASQREEAINAFARAIGFQVN
jgi:hypothetical protein